MGRNEDEAGLYGTTWEDEPADLEPAEENGYVVFFFYPFFLKLFLINNAAVT